MQGSTMDTAPPRRYLIRQPGKDDQEFSSVHQVVKHLVDNPGFAAVYADGQVLMTKGMPPVRGLEYPA